MKDEYELKDEDRTRCEVWTRVMGYHRPIASYINEHTKTD